MTRARDTVRGLLVSLGQGMWPGYPAVDPYACDAGHITTWIYPKNYAAIAARRSPRCRCGLEMGPAPTSPLFEWTLRRALREAAESIVPALTGFDLIRNRTGGPRGTADSNDDGSSPR